MGSRPTRFQAAEALGALELEGGPYLYNLDAVNKKYRELALKYHTDRPGTGNAAKFSAISNAISLLREYFTEEPRKAPEPVYSSSDLEIKPEERERGYEQRPAGRRHKNKYTPAEGSRGYEQEPADRRGRYEREPAAGHENNHRPAERGRGYYDHGSGSSRAFRPESGHAGASNATKAPPETTHNDTEPRLRNLSQNTRSQTAQQNLYGGQIHNNGYRPPSSEGYYPPYGYRPPSSEGYYPPYHDGYIPPSSEGYYPPYHDGYIPPSNVSDPHKGQFVGRGPAGLHHHGIQNPGQNQSMNSSLSQGQSQSQNTRSQNAAPQNLYGSGSKDQSPNSEKKGTRVSNDLFGREVIHLSNNAKYARCKPKKSERTKRMKTTTQAEAELEGIIKEGIK